MLPRVKIVMIGAIKKKPMKSPVHLAHNGNCIPFIKNERSGSWWQRKSFLKKAIDFCQHRNCFSFFGLEFIPTIHTLSYGLCFFVFYSTKQTQRTTKRISTAGTTLIDICATLCCYEMNIC